ncbi:MFS transporter [Kocuria varians]|uniref:MFS transporter n=1 Tax=Kocuria varians TaxID=1272 RepID=UPI00227849DB
MIETALTNINNARYARSMTSTLRAARWATLVYFILCGTLVGTWLVRIPVIEERAGIGHSTLGTLLVLLGVGAFLGMQVAGRLSDRLGVHRVVPVSAVLASLTVVLPGLAGNLWTLAAALVVFGFCHGCLDASMNAHAVHVEEGYGRPVMSSFHAMFSIGGVIAALAGAALAFVGPAAGMGVVGVVSAVVAVVSARWLLRVDLAPLPRHSTPTTPRPPPRAAAPPGASGSSPPWPCS